MAKNTVRGTALYCGIDVSFEQMKEHLRLAGEVGINALFTSLQLPESDRDAVLRDMPRLAEEAHEHGIQVDADVGPRTASKFGLDLHKASDFKRFGVDVIRLDYGYTPEQTAEFSHNTDGLMLELNAVCVTPGYLETLDRLGIDKENVRFCHNYYPVTYTGMKPARTLEINRLIRQYGYRIGGFIASQSHRRLACNEGLPTLERHRNMDIHAVLQEMMLLEFDDISFGDDLASAEELRALAQFEAEPVVTFRIKADVDHPVIPWLDGRQFSQMQCGREVDAFVRSSFGDAGNMYRGFRGGITAERRAGDVTILRDMCCRYAGEVQIVRMNLPASEKAGKVAHVIPEDLPILEVYLDGQPFRLKVV